MFPIRDHNPSERTPYVTYMLIIINVVIFLMMLPASGDEYKLAAFYNDFATIPAFIAEGQNLHTVLTSMFLHAGWFHLAGNMLFLWIFGDNLEDSFGHIPFLIFYLLCGLAADFAHIITDLGSLVPTVGASGAIAGVMGGYLLLFPKARVDVIFFFLVFFKRFTIPAWIVLIIWFGLQIFNGVGADLSGGGVAYGAHIGGFIAGFLLTLPYWFRHHGKQYWQTNDYQPPHPPAEYVIQKTRIPTIRRRR